MASAGWRKQSYLWFVIGVVELAGLLGLLLWTTTLPRSLVGNSNCLSTDETTDICYCEALLDGPLKERSNSLSALGFSAVGLVILLILAIKPPPQSMNRLTSDMAFPLAYAYLAVFLGPGSMMFHSQLSGLGGFFDTFSMYNWLGWVVAYDIVRILNVRQRQALVLLAAYLGIVIAFTVVQQIIVDNLPKGNGGNTVFAALVVCAVVSELGVLFSNRGYNLWSAWRFLILGVTLFLAGLVIWFLSQTGNILCFPHALAQGHAVWHLMTAGTVGLVFRYLWLSPDRPDASAKAISPV